MPPAPALSAFRKPSIAGRLRRSSRALSGRGSRPAGRRAARRHSYPDTTSTRTPFPKREIRRQLFLVQGPIVELPRPTSPDGQAGLPAMHRERQQKEIARARRPPPSRQSSRARPRARRSRRSTARASTKPRSTARSKKRRASMPASCPIHNARPNGDRLGLAWRSTARAVLADLIAAVVREHDEHEVRVLRFHCVHEVHHAHAVDGRLALALLALVEEQRRGRLRAARSACRRDTARAISRSRPAAYSGSLSGLHFGSLLRQAGTAVVPSGVNSSSAQLCSMQPDRVSAPGTAPPGPHRRGFAGFFGSSQKCGRRPFGACSSFLP